MHASIHKSGLTRLPLVSWRHLHTPLPRLTRETGGKRRQAASAVAAPSAPAKPQASSSEEAKVVGVLVGALCGNVLGAPVQHDRHYHITRQHPDGLTEFWQYDLGQQPVKLGQYTGDFSYLLAAAHSLVEAGTCDVTHMVTSIVQRCDPGRRYNMYCRLLLDALSSQGVPLERIPQLAEDYFQAAFVRTGSTSSDRIEREPFGPNDHGAAARIAPVAIAYRAAGEEVLEEAVQLACSFSHTQPEGLDAARVAAAAVKWLLKRQPGQAEGPQQLLQHLQTVAQTVDMRAKLQLLLDNLFQVEEIRSWRPFFKSQQWHRLTNVLSRITYHDYATTGTEAVAVALWALVTSWASPRQAVTLSVHFAGSAPVTSQITGALAGALHGDAWVPSTWWNKLENGEFGGRDDVVRVAKRLAALQCTSVGTEPDPASQ